jgi:membrane associated rhomboid family serine protease
MPTCYRHPSRETGVSCANCGRPICPDCMTTTPVGMRCPECSKQRTKVVRLRDTARMPQATYALIVINVIAFLAEGPSAFTLGGAPNGTVYLKGALLGSSEFPQLAGQGVAHGQLWRIVSGGFLHDSFLHIGLNMYVLYILGCMLEPALGRVKFLSIYAVALFTGSLGALLVSPHALTVGASGAVFGVMGAAAVEMRARKIPVMQSGVGTLILINLVISFTLPGISWGGHVGGLIGGGLAAYAFQHTSRLRTPALAYAACVLLAVVGIGGSIEASKSSEVETATLPPGFSNQQPPE